MTSPSRPDEEPRLFHEGLALFNRGEFFAAHEVWEDIWHMASGERKRFFQGLIQCAVSLEHLRRGNPRGARSVFATAQTKFRGLPPIFEGVDVPRLLRDMETALAPVPDPPTASNPPHIELIET